MKVLYKTFEQRLFLEDWGYYQTYGIQCCSASTGEVLAVIQDISTDRKFVTQLAKRCTRGQLSPLHFWDVVLDALDEPVFY